jgi:uncharacterized membrane protein YoaK (UPF0700 family)
MHGNWRIILATFGKNIFQSSQFKFFILLLLGNVLSIAFFNFAGISVTKELSATTRMVLDSGRTLIIWVVSLALQWQSFFPLQIVGFALLVIGMGIYNGVWELIIRQIISRPPISNERSQLLPSYEDVSVYQSIAPTGAPISDAIST